MRKIGIILTVSLLLIAGGYFYYVRGFGVKPNIPEQKQVVVNNSTLNFSWQIKKDALSQRTEVTAATASGRLYLFGGFNALGQTSSKVEIYDPTTDSWQDGPQMPEGRHHAGAVSLGEKIYIIGGFSGSANWEPKSEVLIFDLQTSLWQKKASIPTPRGGLAVAVIEGKIYAVGGIGRDGLSNKLEVYNPPTDSWETKADAPTKRDHLAAASFDGLLYVVGGREQSLDKNLSLLEIYDPIKDRWTQGPPMPTARGGIAAAVLKDLIIVVGGEQPSSTFNQVEAFDPKTATWYKLPNLPSPRHGLAAVTLGGKMYVLGGGRQPGLSVSAGNEVLELH